MIMKKLITVITSLLVLTLLVSCSGGGDEWQGYRHWHEEGITGEESNDSELVVIIDPGHGFDDPGSSPEYLDEDEKVYTLKAAEALKTELERRGIKTVLTHNGTTFPDEDDIAATADRLGIRYDRDKIINNNVFAVHERAVYTNVLAHEYPNSVLISLHTNSVDNAPEVSGMSIDYYAEGSNALPCSYFSDELKRAFEGELGERVTVFADTADEAYVVNKYVNIPSVLIELGYGSNAHDAANIKSDEWMTKFAITTAETVRNFFEN